MLKNIVASWGEILVAIVSVFVLYPFFVQTFGEGQYGIWLLITSVMGYFKLLSLGVPLATVKHISKYWAQNDFDKVNEVIGTCLLLYGAIAIVVLLTGSALALNLDLLFPISPQYRTTAKGAALLATFEVAISFVFEVFEGTLHAQQRLVFLSGLRSCLTLVRMLLTILLVRRDNGLIIVAALLVTMTIAQGFISALYVRRHFPVMRFRVGAASRTMLAEVFQYSIWALLLNVAGLISFKTDPIVIGSVVSIGAIVYFSVANNLLLYLAEAIRGISQALMPRASALDALDQTGELGAIYSEYSRLTYLILLPVCVMFVLLGGDFIALWMGESYRLPSGRVLNILTVSYLFYLVQRGVAFPVLMGRSRLKIPTLMMLSSALANALLSIFWGRVWNIEGVAWGTTIPSLVLTLGLVAFTTQELGLNVWKYVLNVYALPSLGLPLLIATSLLVRSALGADTFLRFALTVTISLMPYGAFAYLMLDRAQQRSLTRLALRKQHVN